METSAPATAVLGERGSGAERWPGWESRGLELQGSINSVSMATAQHKLFPPW